MRTGFIQLFPPDICFLRLNTEGMMAQAEETRAFLGEEGISFKWSSEIQHLEMQMKQRQRQMFTSALCAAKDPVR